jgi:hypothetical protein
MFRWKMKIISYTSFCWISNIVLSDTLSDEKFSLFCTSFLFLFLDWNEFAIQYLNSFFVCLPRDSELCRSGWLICWISYCSCVFIGGSLIGRVSVSVEYGMYCFFVRRFCIIQSVCYVPLIELVPLFKFTWAVSVDLETLCWPSRGGDGGALACFWLPACPVGHSALAASGGVALT